jgi:hypothetical protein
MEAGATANIDSAIGWLSNEKPHMNRMRGKSSVSCDGAMPSIKRYHGQSPRG